MWNGILSDFKRKILLSLCVRTYFEYLFLISICRFITSFTNANQVANWKDALNCCRRADLVLERNQKKAIECRTCGKIEFAFAQTLDGRKSNSHAETYSSHAIKILGAISQFARLYWLQTDIWLTFHDLHRQRCKICTACGLQWILKSVSMLKVVSSGLKMRKTSAL